MYLEKEKQFGAIHDERHNQEMELLENIKKNNDKLIADLEKEK